MNEHSSSYDVTGICALLEKEKTFANLYNLSCSHGNDTAATYLENGNKLTVSYSQLATVTDVWTSYLGKRFPEKERVAISLDTCKDWFPLFWGLVRSGHDTLLLDPACTDQKTVMLMEQAGCKAIVSGKRRKLPACFNVLDISELRELDCSTAPIVLETSWGSNVALCTSGTTSDSQIFVYNESTICEIALLSLYIYNRNKLFISDSPHNTLAFLPFHHVLGFAAVFVWSTFLGFNSVFLKDRSAQTIQETVLKCCVTQIVTVPLLANSLTKSFYASLGRQNPVVRTCIRALLSASIFFQHLFPKAGHDVAGLVFHSLRKKLLGNSLKTLILGGSYANPEALRLLNALGYLTVCGFGMTETSITSFELSWRLQNRLKGSIGAPLPGTEYRLKGSGNTGELQVRGTGLHDARFLNGRMLPALTDSDGWMDTGDLVRTGRHGQFFVEGRIKDVIIGESGENVYPDELEALFSEIEGVSQYAIVGLPQKNSRYQDIALVMNIGDRVADDGFTASLTAQVVSISRGLPVFKRIRRLLVTGYALPTANSFKIRKQMLVQSIVSGDAGFREITLDGSASAAIGNNESVSAPDWENRDAVIGDICKVFADVLQIPADSVGPDSHFVDGLGGDSLQIMSVTIRLEEMYGVIIPDDEYVNCATPAAAADMIHRLQSGGSDRSAELVERTPVVSFTDSEEYKAFEKRREALLANGNDPYFVPHSSALRDTCVIDGREYIDFGNYNYAGMSGRPEVSEAAKKAIDQYGTSASGSRLLAGEKPVHGELERAIAEWKHTEAAIVCVGGHSTNVTFVGNFCGRNDLILYDALAHNSVAQGCRLSSAVTKPFPHNDTAALEAMLQRERKYFEKVLIAIEGVYSMDGDIAPVPEFVRIKKQYGCFLMVDEAHSACVLGPTGAGVDEYYNMDGNDIDIKMGTLSKGLGTCGGYIAGRRELIQYLKYNLPGFVFSVGISPALAAASLEAIRLLREDSSIMQRMARNIECFAAEARKRNLNICMGGKSAILPVLVGSDEDAVRLSNEMQSLGVCVPPAVYPAVPVNRARLRFDVTSEHNPEQIVYALDSLVKAAQKLDITLPPAE